MLLNFSSPKELEKLQYGILWKQVVLKENSPLAFWEEHTQQQDRLEKTHEQITQEIDTHTLKLV